MNYLSKTIVVVTTLLFKGLTQLSHAEKGVQYLKIRRSSQNDKRAS